MKSFSKAIMKLSLVLIIVGIVFIIVGFSTSGRWFGYHDSNYELKDVTKEFTENIQNLDFRIDVGKLVVRQGDTFKVEADNINEETFVARVENGTLIIDNSNTNEFNLFGIEFNPLYIGLGENGVSNITVYVPEGYIVDHLKVDVAAGNVSLQGLTANIAEINVDAGKCTGDDLVINKETQIQVEVGDMSLNQVYANNVQIDCSVGSVDLSGEIYGDNTMRCSVGDINLDLDGVEEDYYFYDVDESLGDVKINDSSYSKNRNGNHSDAASKISLDCSLGSINIDTK